MHSWGLHRILREGRVWGMILSVNQRWPDFRAIDDRTLQLNPHLLLRRHSVISKAATEMTGIYTEMWPHPKASSSTSSPHSLCLLWLLPALLKGSISDPTTPYSTSGHGLMHMLAASSSFAPAFDPADNVQQMQMPRSSWNQFKEYFMSSNCLQCSISWVTGSWREKAWDDHMVEPNGVSPSVVSIYTVVDIAFNYV